MEHLDSTLHLNAIHLADSWGGTPYSSHTLFEECYDTPEEFLLRYSQKAGQCIQKNQLFSK